ncbi:MAG: hypothetical protein HYW91_01420 [Candidatus Sungbacteria bacterium]|nr:hypothetical protein [Candidatus Sungbacteria bacterium]
MKEKYFWVGTGIIILVGLTAFFVVRFFTAKESAPQPTASVNEQKQIASESNLPRGSTVGIKSGEEAPAATIQYFASGFSPKKILLRQDTGGYGCLLQIVNASNQSLIIRLSPHSDKDEQGFAYDPIPAGGISLIDPRYRIPKIAFHNHEKPDEEFSVELGEGCKLD